MAGWIKLHRVIQNSKLYLDLNAKQRDVLIQILLMANYEEKSWVYHGESLHCFPGQLITSLHSLKRNCAKDVSIQTIRTTIKKLESYGFITNESTNLRRCITITNWKFYQSIEERSTNSKAGNELDVDSGSTPINNIELIKKKEDIHPICKLINKHYSCLNDMKEPLSNKQAELLEENFSLKEIKEILLSMSNWKKLNMTRSTYSVAFEWLMRNASNK